MVHVPVCVDPRACVAAGLVPLDVVAHEVLLQAQRGHVVDVEELERALRARQPRQDDVAPRGRPKQLRNVPAKNMNLNFPT